MTPNSMIAHVKQTVRRQGLPFLRTFLAISAVGFALWQASLYLDAVLDYHRRIGATQEAVSRAREALNTTLQTYSADLRILARNPALRRLAAGDQSYRDIVTRSFEAVVAEKPVTAQLRYLDREGREVVRVDQRGKDVVVVDEANLQNKADRYYFRDSIGIPAGALYVSPLDLNVEHGEIETPWKPMLRLATPIAVKGKTDGVVIINIAAADFISAIRREQSINGTPIQLLNENGYWLAGVAENELWGFMFGRDTTMAKVNPRLWKQVSAGDSGEFDAAGNHYIFSTLRPNAYVAVDGAAVQPSSVGWTILANVPGISIADLWRRENVAVALIGLLVIAVISWGWSGTIAARREAEVRKRDTEVEMVRVERLASLGSLVAGVAHELNTPIGNAVTIASTLSEQVGEFEAAMASGQIKRATVDTFVAGTREGTQIMLRGLERASTLIGHFKQIAVDQTSEQRRTFRLADLARDIVAALQPQFRHDDVTLNEAIAARGELDSYPGLLGQVLINLINNAQIHAFEEGMMGRRIEVSARDLSPKEVEITVRDNGRGMPAAIQQRIFEPFFTTRLGSGGSGLGLSIVFNIVTNLLGGTIHVESAPGRGTAVIVRLPVCAPAANQPLGRSYDSRNQQAA